MNNQRCANLACICDVGMIGDACGDYCKSLPLSDPASIRCECGHAKCVAEMNQEMGEG